MHRARLLSKLNRLMAPMLLLAAGTVAAECPAVLSEAAPLGDPPHSAQVMVLRNENCPQIAKVSAVLYRDDERISTRTFYDDTFLNPPLRYPVRETLTLPDVAGLYRIEWVTEFMDGSAQTYVQTFAVPCDAPAAVEVYWDDADANLRLVAPPGDRCEESTRASLSLRDIGGQVVPQEFTTTYRTDAGESAEAVLPLSGLDGERRYVGDLTLTNASGESTVVPVEFITGCGDLVPSATIVGSRMMGSVDASQCQFPITLEVSAVHETGEVVQSVNALLMDDEFDFELPEFATWPAGEYTIETQFIGAVGRARHENTVTIACVDPRLTEPELQLNDDAGQADVVFSLQGRDQCQSDTRVSLQVRDANNVVVFNRSADLTAGVGEQEFHWPFRGIPGSAYDLGLTVSYGAKQQSTVTKSRRTTYECTAPKVLSFGFSNADASHLGALVALTQCNAPATAKLVVQNESGRVVVDAEPQIIQDVGTAYARVAPISLGHLDSGNYEATLVISDNRSRTDAATFDVHRDVDGPAIAFFHNDIELAEGEIPTLQALSDLSLSFQDSNAPMVSFTPVADMPDAFGGQSTADFVRVDGEATPQMWITGTIDIPRSEQPPAFVGVLSRASDGRLWLAPISRRYVPSARVELDNYHPSRQRLAFRAVARVQPLQPERYDILGVVVSDALGGERLVPGSGSFDVSALSSQQHDAILRQGVTEIPIALNWSDQNTARLERVTSVPDGDYTLSAVGRDIFGNTSQVYSRVVRLNQQKQRASLDWPAIAGYQRTVRHRFREADAASQGPLRVLYRRVSGYGDIRINDSNITEQTSEDLLVPDTDGAFVINIELLDAEIDARFVLHADSTDAVPLELEIRTFRPEFVTQRKRTQNQDVLSINHGDQPCRNVVFDDLGQVSLRATEVLCAVRLNIPGTSVISTTDERTDVRLPPGVSNDSLYEEGFVRAVNGMPTFTPTRQVAIKDMQAYSSTPQITFVPLSEWRSRAKSGKYLTGVGNVVAGHFVIRAGLGEPLVLIDDEAITLPPGAAGTYRLPVRTNTRSLGDVYAIRIRAHYPDTPNLVADQRFEFAAVPQRVFVEAISGQFVSPGELNMVLEIRDGSGHLDVSRHGKYQLESAEIIPRDSGRQSPPAPTVTLEGSNTLNAKLGAVQPGAYRLQLTLTNTDPRFVDYLAPIKTDAVFEVLDGTPVAAELFTFRQSDKTPFFGQISVDYPDAGRRSDVSRIAWQISTDGKTFEDWQCCGSAIDFALSEPGVRFYRAELTNRHSEAVSHTPPIRIDAYLSGQLRVRGPRHTFRGYPATYTVDGLPDGYEVLWRVTAPNANKPIEHRSATLTIPAEETGTYVVEVVADTATENPDSRSALRTFFTLEAAWPRLPESVISGPTQVEYGKAATFTVTHPPIFKERGNPLVKRVGQWELPDGTRVDDDEWAQFTLRELPEGYVAVNVLYHTWIEDDPTTLTTAVHRIEPISYRWPNWQLKVATNSVEPPAILRLSVSPEDWHEWMGLGASPITTHWELPDYVRVLDRSPTEAIVYAVDDREFDVVARITDPRGNVTELQQRGIRPLKQIPFEISLSVVAERTLHTAPLEVTAQVDPIVLPKGRAITRVAFYVDGLYRGVSDGAPLKLQLRSPGEHELRAIASIDAEFTADDSVTLLIGENHQAKCTITSVGNFRLNGLAKAQCDDPDGHMIEYRWYLDGQLLSDTGTRVQLSNTDRLGMSELSLVAVDNAGIETTARFVPPPEG